MRTRTHILAAVITIIVGVSFIMLTAVVKPLRIGADGVSALFSGQLVSIAGRYADKPGTLVVRLRDGLSQFFTGEQTVAFSRSGRNATLFADTTANLIIAGEKVITVAIDPAHGKIIDASYSPDETYAALHAVTDDGTHSFCVFKLRLGLNSVPCNNLTVVKGTSQSLWLPENEHTFVVYNSETSIVLWNLDDPKWFTVEKDTNPLIYSHVKEALDYRNADWLGCTLGICVSTGAQGTDLFTTSLGIFDSPITATLGNGGFIFLNENRLIVGDATTKQAYLVDVANLKELSGVSQVHSRATVE